MRKQAQHLLHLTRNRRNAPLNLREQVLLYAERLVQAFNGLVERRSSVILTDTEQGKGRPIDQAQYSFCKISGSCGAFRGARSRPA
jgi:hypothetical protein